MKSPESQSETEGAVTETRTAHIRYRHDGIMVVIYKPGVELTIDEMRANAQAYTTLTTKLPLPFLADIRGVKSADKGARQWGSSPEAKEITLASAILTGSLMSKMIGNIFYQLNKPPYPFRMFTNRNEAVAWLKQFMD